MNGTNNQKKQKLANRTAYAILALLLIAVLTVTVIAIVATVSRRGTELPPEGEPPANDSGNDGSVPETPDNGDAGAGNGNGESEPPSEDNGEQKPTAPVFVLPANGYVMKDYSEDILVFSGTMNDYRVHLGVDIAGNVGDPVYTFAEGTVKEIKDDPFMGKTVIISHSGNLESRYMNLAEQLPEGIKVGATVSVGTVIGAIGESAISECAESAHLHFEVYANGKQVDPAGYVTFNSELNAGSDTED